MISKNISILILTAIFLIFCLTSMSQAGGINTKEEANVGKMLKDACDSIEKIELSTAEENLNKVLQKEPDNPAALNNMAVIMAKKKQYKDALVYLEKAMPLAKDFSARAD